jgi:hypothetical protein
MIENHRAGCLRGYPAADSKAFNLGPKIRPLQQFQENYILGDEQTRIARATMIVTHAVGSAAPKNALVPVYGL